MHYYIDVVDPEPPGESAAWSRRYAELQPRLVRALAATAGNYVGWRTRCKTPSQQR
jgi:hypothetical protein